MNNDKCFYMDKPIKLTIEIKKDGTYILDVGQPHSGRVQVVYVINDTFAMVKDVVDETWEYEWVVNKNRLSAI